MLKLKVRNYPSKDKVKCDFCEKSFRKDRLDSHENSFHKKAKIERDAKNKRTLDSFFQSKSSEDVSFTDSAPEEKQRDKVKYFIM